MFKIFEWRKLAIVFHKSILSLNELIGYVESTDSNEIWPEYSFTIREPKVSGNSCDLDISYLTAANATGSANYLLLKLCLSLKK